MIIISDKTFKDGKRTRGFFGKFFVKETFKQHIKYLLFGHKIFSKTDKYETLMGKLNGLDKKICTRLTNIYDTETVSSLHQKVFPQFKNKHINDEICIIGTGPTLSEYVPIKNTVNIGCNRAFQYDKVKLDYLFAADWYGISTYINDAKDYDCIKFYGKFLEDNCPEFLRIPEHVLNQATYNYYCRFVIENLSPDLEVSPLLNSGTIAATALHFALYTHPKKIYLVGLDTNTTGNFDKEKHHGAPMNVDLVMKGYHKLKKFMYIHYPDVEIVSVNPVGLRGIFTDVYQEEKKVPVPFEYKFADLGNHGIYVNGLSFVENDFRWSEKEEAIIRFKLEKKSAVTVKFLTSIWPELLKDNGDLVVDLFINDKFYSTENFSPRQLDYEIIVNVAKEDISLTNEVCIKFKFNSLKTPEMLKLNKDYRFLGIQFKGLSIEKK